MTTPEGKIKQKLDRMFKAEQVVYFCPQAGPYGTHGVHDRIACVAGLFVTIEAKASPKEKLTAKQEEWRDKVLAEGGTYFRVDSKETIEQVRQFIVNARDRGLAGISHSSP